MLAPDRPFLENGSKEVKFPDDDPSAFQTVLQILHGQFSSLPQCMSFSDLFKLSVLTDKYLLLDTVRPFMFKWLSIFDVDEDTHTKSLCEDKMECEKLLFVAWTFGLKTPFLDALKFLVLNTVFEDNGDVVLKLKVSRLIQLQYIPEDVIGKLVLYSSFKL